MTQNILEIEEQWIGDVPATAADLTVQVHGDQLFGGDVALEKAKEVKALKDALVRAGLPADAVSLSGLRAHVTTGLFSRSSSAYYTLVVRVQDLGKLTGAFDAVVGAKQAELLGVRWIHEPPEALVGGWLAGCAKRARHAADALTAALGTEIEGIAFCRSHLLGRERLEADVVHMHTLGMPRARKSGIGGALAEADAAAGSTELAPTKRMGVRVELGFRLAS